MSGHSKWNTIKRKKEKTDQQRAKIFTKIGREILVAVKESGADISTNSKLKDLIAKAKINNVPNENIDRIIKKAAGGSDRNDYETIVYEGYGIGGVAVIVETLTDNKNRTAAEMRHYFDKFGGNLGTPGCVSFLFAQKGVIIIENITVDEDKIMDDVFDAGAFDFSFNEGYIEIFADSNDLSKVREALENKGYKLESAGVELIPSTYITLTEEEQMKKMRLLLDMLEDNDDVQEVFHNWENEEDYE